MIQFKPYPLNDVQDLRNLLSNNAFPESLNDLLECKAFVVEDGNRVMGLCTYEFLNEHLAVVRSIYITPEERGNKFGDALIRSVLNSIEIHGRNHVIFLGNSDELKFYSHVGMEPFDESVLALDGVKSKLPIGFDPLNGLYLNSIKDFFAKPCKGH